MAPVDFTCSHCGANNFLRRKRVKVRGLESPEKGPALAPSCANCLGQLMDLSGYANDLSNIRDADFQFDAANPGSLRIASDQGTVEVEVQIDRVRVEYYVRGRQSVVNAKSYEFRSDAVREIRAWLSKGAA